MRNFIFKQVFLLLLTFFYAFSVKAQKIEGFCTSVKVTNEGLAWPTDAFIRDGSGVGWKQCPTGPYQGGCCWVLSSVLFAPMAAISRYRLQEKQNGIFITTQGPQISPTFSGLSKGIYRVEIEVPRYRPYVNCLNTVAKMFDTWGRLIGWEGDWNPTRRYTNEVYVGATTQYETTFKFLDTNGTNSQSLKFDANEDAKIQTDCQFYDRWWLAIFEKTGNKRYWSQGWTFGGGTMPSQINLSQKWNSAFGGNFLAGNSYMVQLAAMTNCNALPPNNSWALALNLIDGYSTFTICPSNSGCREVKDLKIILSPNPASNTFRFNNLEDGKEYNVILTDLRGKSIKSLSSVTENQEIDVSDIPDGLYFANLFDGAKKVQTAKLSVVK